MPFDEFITFVIKWFQTRRWKSLFLQSLPLACFIFAVLGLVVYGLSGSEMERTQKYLDMAEELQKASTDSDSSLADSGAEQDGSLTEASSETQEQVGDYAGLLLRRVLQSQQFNPKASYYIARQMERQGRIGTARQMMRKIAPLEGENGYPPAHAWLALKQYETAVRTRAPIKKDQEAAWLKDLSAGAESPDFSTPLLLLYSEVLHRKGNTKEALETLKKKKDERPELLLMIAELARASENDRDFRDAVLEAKQHFSEIAQTKNAKPNDFANMARAYFLAKEFDVAIQAAQYGLKEAAALEDSEQRTVIVLSLRKLLANIYLGRYNEERSEDTTPNSLALQLLDAALKADPTNPAVIQELTRLISEGQKATASMTATLESSLLDGTATGLTHLLRANLLLVQGKAEEALPHLESAHRRTPDSPVIMNNLAIALLDQPEPDYNRALELTTKALRNAGLKPSMQASMLDTKGQILEKQGDVQGAIICYEDAIGIEPKKLSTRKRLAEAYRKENMTEMADRQLGRVAELEAEQAASSSQSE